MGICGFNNLNTQNHVEDLSECSFSKMIKNIKLQLICLIKHRLFFILESPGAEMRRNILLKIDHLHISDLDSKIIRFT